MKAIIYETIQWKLSHVVPSSSWSDGTFKTLISCNEILLTVLTVCFTFS